MMSVRMMAAYTETAFLMPKYEKARKEAQKLDIVMSILYKTPMVGPYAEHPKFAERSQGFIDALNKYNGTKNGLTIAFGDSILDMYRDRWQAVPSVFDYAVGGFHHFHMLHMAQVMKPVLDAKGIYPKHIIIGTLGGNPLLQHQEINSVIDKSYECLNGLRGLWPLSELIVYGLPPVMAMYATSQSVKFEQAIYSWIMKDTGYSVFIPMQKDFAGKYGLFPKSWMTAEGVHLSPVGMVTLDDRFDRAKSAIPKSIVD